MRALNLLELKDSLKAVCLKKCDCYLSFLGGKLTISNAFFGGSQKGGFKRVVLADVPLERKPERGYVRQNHPFTKPPFYLPMTLFGVDKRVVSKRVVSADVPPKRKPERGYVRQNHPFTKPPFYLPMTLFGVDKRVVSKRLVSADVPPE